MSNERGAGAGRWIAFTLAASSFCCVRGVIDNPSGAGPGNGDGDLTDGATGDTALPGDGDATLAGDDAGPGDAGGDTGPGDAGGDAAVPADGDASLPDPCGNGLLDDGEVCDDQGANSDAWSVLPHCDAHCSGLAPYCGDGAIAVSDEDCDDADRNSAVGWTFQHCNQDCSAVVPATTCAYAISRSLGAPAATWERVGPPGGNVRALLALGNDVVLAGSGGAGREGGLGAALYRSTDGGATWVEVLEAAGSAVVDLARVPGTSPARVWAAVGSSSGSASDGVYLSTDGGATFNDASAGLPADATGGGRRLRRLAVAAGTPERVYAMVEGDSGCPLCARATLWRRDDPGDWTPLAAAGVDPDPGGPALALAADRSQHDRVFLADGARFYRSDDAGASFSPTLFGDTVFVNGLAWVRQLYADPSLQDHLVVATHDNGYAETFDGGATFSPPPLWFGNTGVTGVAFRAGGLLLSTTDAGLVTVRGGGWQRLGGCLSTDAVWALSVAPDDPDQIVVGTSGSGAWRSSDGGASFQPPTSGMDELFGRVRVSGGAPGPLLWLATATGLFTSSDRGSTFVRVPLSTTPACASDIAGHPAANDRVSVTTDETALSGCSRNQGVLDVIIASGSVTAATGLSGRNAAAVVHDPTVEGRAFAFQARAVGESTAVSSGVAASGDYGASFALSTMAGTAPAFAHRPLALTSSGVVLAGIWPTEPGPGVYRQLWESSDGGASSTVAWNNEDAPSFTPFGVAANGNDDLFLWGWGTTYGILRRADGESAFAEHGAGLTSWAAFVSDLVVTPGDGLLVATQDGVYYAADGVNFVAFNDDLPAGAKATWVAVLPGTPAVAFVVTEADGVFRRAL